MTCVLVERSEQSNTALRTMLATTSTGKCQWVIFPDLAGALATCPGLFYTSLTSKIIVSQGIGTRRKTVGKAIDSADW